LCGAQFAPYGVSPQQFFELLRHGKWTTAEAGTVLVQRGEPLTCTYLVHSGGAVGDAAAGQLACVYEGHAAPIDAKGAPAPGQTTAGCAPEQARGCIIGGTALVEPELIGQPYPHTVRERRFDPSLDDYLMTLPEMLRC
jgi:hypothetical protein